MHVAAGCYQISGELFSEPGRGFIRSRQARSSHNKSWHYTKQRDLENAGFGKPMASLERADFTSMRTRQSSIVGSVAHLVASSSARSVSITVGLVKTWDSNADARTAQRFQYLKSGAKRSTFLSPSNRLLPLAFLNRRQYGLRPGVSKI